MEPAHVTGVPVHGHRTRSITLSTSLKSLGLRVIATVDDEHGKGGRQELDSEEPAEAALVGAMGDLHDHGVGYNLDM